ncbi:Bax inhibitor-1/YccA family protein [Zavarzinia compransoris]|uniref:Bax inhibitor-1/YccA family protein n=1 Tax=Zavarzinia marina TaxID=2911065 RepID=UPI001F2FE08F|nr:Bax inhibitor-1/YccA family protein [Zavarzinia marina]MCF4164373.1 Bax inhibitor-1/YccA family protein [Zavarzinia marina]
MRSGNPMLRDTTFTREIAAAGDAMTVSGVVNKTGILLLAVIGAGAYMWYAFANAVAAGDEARIGVLGTAITVALVVAIVASLATIFKRTWAGVTAPVYAVAEGVLLGGISLFFEMAYPGIVVQAVMLTFGVFGVLLFLYRSGIIRATENFKLMVVSATGAIALVYLVDIVMSFFGVRIPMIHEGGTIGIVFSLIVVAIAALNLVLDFDFIEKGAEVGAPRYMEWYAAFGLLVTLVWLYLEILRLLAKIRSSN